MVLPVQGSAAYYKSFLLKLISYRRRLSPPAAVCLLNENSHTCACPHYRDIPTALPPARFPSFLSITEMEAKAEGSHGL